MTVLRRDEFEHQRAAVLQVNEPAQSPSIQWIEVDRQFASWPAPSMALKRARFPCRRLGGAGSISPATSENVSICRSSEAVEPCGSFFGLDPVEDSDRGRDVPHEIVIR